MLELEWMVRQGLDPEKLAADVRKRVDLGTARAADIVAGSLRRYSLSIALHGRTGMLARAWGAAIREGEGAYRLTNRMPYAAIQEEGGEIHAKNVPHLTIPLPPALTPRGVAKYKSAREAIEKEKLFYLRNRGTGKEIMAKRIGGGKIEAWFALKESVTIPASHYATRAIEAAKPAAEREVERALKG